MLCVCARVWACRETQEEEGRGNVDGDKRQRGLCGPVMMKFHETEKHMQPSAPEVKHIHTHSQTHSHTCIHTQNKMPVIRDSPCFQEAQRLVEEINAHTINSCTSE